MRQVQKKKLEEELNAFWNLLWRLYSHERRKGHNRARAFALAYAKALKRAGIDNVKVMIANLDEGTSIENMTDKFVIDNLTKIAVGMKLKMTKIKEVNVLFDDERYLVKILTF